MAVQYSEIQELLRSRADLNARLNLMPYDGTPEINAAALLSYVMIILRLLQLLLLQLQELLQQPL